MKPRSLIAIVGLVFWNGGILAAREPDAECVKWFQNGNIIAGTNNCPTRCSSLATTMSTFVCPGQCRLLCHADDEPLNLATFLYYPGLTPAEQQLVHANPNEALVVFIQKTRAEISTDRNFPKQGFNDEADAFRHYVWAGLLTKEMGAERAQIYLDAHEDNRLEPAAEKAMDLANNRGGILGALKLIKSGRFTLETLEGMALQDLHQRRLVILNPGLRVPKGQK